MSGEVKEPAEQWAFVEIMGHRSHYGRISEVTFAGVPLVRVEVPLLDGTFKEFRYGGAALFGVEPLTEEQVRACAARAQGAARHAVARLLAPVLSMVDDDADDAEQVCRVCGCSELDACPDGCSWVAEDLCSACDGGPSS